MTPNFLLIGFLLVLGFGCAYADSGTLPDPNSTPGDLMVDPHTGKPTGRPKGSTKDIRNVPKSLAQQAFDEYSIPASHRNGTDYEIDHLISLVIGGSNDLKNLWPQTRDRSVEWNAWEKDKLEDKLYHLVDAGVVSIDDAQRDISSNWVQAYEKYMPMTINGQSDYEVATTAQIRTQSYRSLYASKFLGSEPPYVHYVLKSGRFVGDPDDK